MKSQYKRMKHILPREVLFTTLVWAAGAAYLHTCFDLNFLHSIFVQKNMLNNNVRMCGTGIFWSLPFRLLLAFSWYLSSPLLWQCSLSLWTSPWESNDRLWLTEDAFRPSHFWNWNRLLNTAHSTFSRDEAHYIVSFMNGLQLRKSRNTFKLLVPSGWMGATLNGWSTV